MAIEPRLRPAVGDSTNLLLKKLVEATQGIAGGGGGGVSSVNGQTGVVTLDAADVGAIPEAPIDGETYGRKDGAWQAIASGYIDGEVQFYTNLPIVIGTPPVDSAYLVREPSGVWLINYHPAGIYIRTGNLGALTDWTYAGEFPDVFSDANFRVYDDADATKQIAFDVSGVTGAKTAAWQNKNGTVAMRGDIAFSALGGSSSFETLNFLNSNGLSFSNSGGSIVGSYTVPSVPAQTVQPVAASASNGSFLFSTLGFSNANNVTFGTSAGSIVTASVAAQSVQTQGSVAILGSTGAISFANGNGITFGGNASTVTASHNGLTSQSNQAFSASGGSSAFQTLNFANSNGFTFSNSNGSIIGSYTVPSVPAQTVQPVAASASNGSFLFSTLGFSNGNNVTFGTSAGSIITASVAAPVAQSTQPVAASASNGSFLFSTLGFSNGNGVTFGTSAGGIITASVNPGGGGGAAISAGANSQSTGTVNFANSNGITFGLSNNGTLTASHNGITSQTNQSLGLFALGNTTQSSSGTQDARSLSFVGAGIASVGVTNGSLVFSVPSGAPSPVNFSAGTTSGDLGSVVFSDANGVTFGLNGSTITASVNAGGAGTFVQNYVPFQLQVNNTSFSSMGQNTLYMQMFVPPFNITFNDFGLYARGTFVSSTNSQAYSQTIRYGLYSQGSGASTSIMSQIGSSSVTMAVSFNSNTAAGYTFGNGGSSFTSSSGGTALLTAISGPFRYYMPFAGSAGINTKYGFAFVISSTTAIGTSPMRFAPLVFTVQNSLSYAQLRVGSITTPSAANYDNWDMVAGTVTTGAMPSTIAFSAMSINVSRQKLFLQMEP